MKILFLSLLYDKKEEEQLLKDSKVGLQGAVNTYQWNIIEGLDKQLKNPVQLLNSLPVGVYPKNYNKLFVKSRKWNHCNNVEDKDIGFINFHFIKQFLRTIRYKIKIKEWLKNNKDEKEKYIILYSLYTPFLRAIKNIKKHNKFVKTCVIVTDLPNEYGFETGTKGIIKWLERLDGNTKLNLAKNVDSYVLLTEYMKEPLKIGIKPYTIIEGLVNINQSDFICDHNKKSDKKVILYTGTLYKQFGIETLVNAFYKIDKDNYELWICGGGEMKEELEDISKKDSRIKFFGYVTKEKALELQQQATVLINPRQNKGEYTKYSFPSKTMEYLLAGKPVIAYNLDGIPDEYDNYICYVNGNEIKDLADKIVEICEKTEDERDRIGKYSKEFVLNEKNCVVQTDKILKMIYI